MVLPCARQENTSISGLCGFVTYCNFKEKILHECSCLNEFIKRVEEKR